MFVVLVYDTAAERNPRVLKTCRKYLHWVQRSVFQGELSAAQYRALTSTLGQVLEREHDGVRIYKLPSAALVETVTLGRDASHTDAIL